MSYKRVKDMARCVIRGRVSSIDGKYYWHTYLWVDIPALIQGAGLEGEGRRVLGCHVPMPVYWEIEDDGTETYVGLRGPKIGEIHFVANEWSEEICAHEAAHATLCWYRYEVEDWYGLAKQEPFDETEEAFCSQLGALSCATYRWLWRVNSYGKHSEQDPA